MPEKICLRRAAAANLLHEIPAKTCRLVQCQFPYIGIRLVMAELSIPLQHVYHGLGLVMADFSIPLQHIFHGLGLVNSLTTQLQTKRESGTLGTQVVATDIIVQVNVTIVAKRHLSILLQHS